MQIEYRQDSRKRYMILSGGRTPGKDEYPVRMLEENSIPGFLPCKVEELDREALFYYDITGWQSLQDFLKAQDAGQSLLELLLYTLAESVEALERYLLPSGCLQAEPALIFVNAAGREMRLVCYPDLDNSFPEQLQSLSEYMLSHLSHEDKAAVAAGYAFYRACAEGEAAADDLRRLAVKKPVQESRRPSHRKDIRRPDTGESRVQAGIAGIAGRPAQTDQTRERDLSRQEARLRQDTRPRQGAQNGYPMLLRQAEEDRREVILSDQAGKDSQDWLFPQQTAGKHNKRNRAGRRGRFRDGRKAGDPAARAKPDEVFSGRAKPDDISAGRPEAKLYAAAAALSAVAAAGTGLFLYFWLGWVQEAWISAAATVCLCWFVLTVLYISRHSAGKSRGKNEAEGLDFREPGLPDLPDPDMEWHSAQDLSAEIPAQKKEQKERTVTISEEAGRLQAYDPAESRALLRPVTGKGAVPLYLYKDMHILGKSPRAADLVISAPTVSRVHAKLTWENGRYFLTDLHSLNGCRVNGKLLFPEKPEALYEDDEILFADRLYRYEKAGDPADTGTARQSTGSARRDTGTARQSAGSARQSTGSARKDIDPAR